MPYLAGIDVSTTGAKALIMDEAGAIRSCVTSEYPLSTPRPLWSEQDPEDWWKGACASLRSALDQAGLSGSDIGAVGLTGQMHGLVLLNRNGAVLRPAILWNDQRTGAECEEITAKAGGLSKLVEWTGNAVLPGFTAPKIIWVARNEPRVYEETAHFLLPKDYVRYRLTGEYATEVSDASGTSLLDVGQRKWSYPMTDLLGIPREWLPRCTESIETSGKISAIAAAETGLMAGTPVVGGAGDQAAQAVGSGIVRPGIISVTSGTSGVVFAHSDVFAAEPQGRLHAFCHAVPGKWHLMGVMLSAGGAFRWLRDHLGETERSLASLTGEDPYDVLTRVASEAPAGSEGLLFLPYLMGERTPHPDPRARGAFIGLAARHRKSHLIRSLLEGVAFGLKDSLELIRELDVPIAEIRASGGGARSALWREIQANVFGCDLVLVNTAEGAAFGAALLAGVGTGAYATVEDAVTQTLRIAERVSPNPNDMRKYAALYSIYRSLYPLLKPCFHDLHEFSYGNR